jgi:hypothetical protein
MVGSLVDLMEYQKDTLLVDCLVVMSVMMKEFRMVDLKAQQSDKY